MTAAVAQGDLDLFSKTKEDDVARSGRFPQNSMWLPEMILTSSAADCIVGLSFRLPLYPSSTQSTRVLSAQHEGDYRPAPSLGS
jgi:hypothetical protein